MHDYKVALGKRLARARGEERKQSEIAKALGEKPNTYRRWEAGETLFPMYHMLQFSRITGFSVYYLTTGDLTYMPHHEPVESTVESDDGTETGDFPKITQTW